MKERDASFLKIRKARLFPLFIFPVWIGILILAGCSDPVSFAVYAENSLIIRSGAQIFNGDVGTRGSGPPSDEAGGYRVEILGAHVDGDVYGASVLLDQDAVVLNVYSDDLTVGRATYRDAFALPDDLPEAPVSTSPEPDQYPLIVPPGSRMILTNSPNSVEVGTEATLVLHGGVYEIEKLKMEAGSRLEAEEPSRLMISQSLEVHDGSYIGPSGEQQVLNLHIIVAGTDVNGVPKAVIGQSSEVRALLTVPNGTLMMKNDVNASGAFFGSTVDIGASATIEHFPGLGLESDQCMILLCEIDGVGGGTIKWTCSSQPLPAGTSCDDGNACTGGDTCNGSGICLSGDPVPDPDPQGLDLCVRDTCDPVAGIYEPAGTVCDTNVQCREPTACDNSGNCMDAGAPLALGTPCDDGIPNNEPDTCLLPGACWGAWGPYNCLANNCSATPGAPPDIECWLTEHPSIATAIRWVTLSSSIIQWSEWEAWRKQELQQALEDAWAWYDSSMTVFTGTPIPEPPTNYELLADNDYPQTVFDETAVAWPLYLAHVAHALMVEIRDLVPWSLCDYDYLTEMFHVLSGQSFFWITQNTVYPGHTVRNPLTPSHPTVTFSFMVQNNLIGTTRLETIAKVLNWARGMTHFSGPFTTKNMENYWQYRGNPPVSRVIDGTIFDPNVYPGPRHWTVGCSGTMGFLQEVLRAVNIPEDNTYVSNPACPHATPYFPSEDRYLSHGDDPYVVYWREGYTSVVPPMEDFLIDQATYTAWFEGDPDEVCNNIGRRPIDLMIGLPPDILVQQYCQDEAQNLTHAQGTVYAVFQNWYTVGELEVLGLWTNLAQQAINLGFCGGN